MEIIDKALSEGRTTLSEYESKQILAAYQIPITRELLVQDVDDLGRATHEIGYPLVLKGCSAAVAHKSEKGLIRLDVRDDQEARTAFEDIMDNLDGPDRAVLVQEMIQGQRELVMGLTRDPQFGPCVMFGLGGIFAEILEDVSFRVAPLTERDAREMMGEIRARKILGAVRGLAAADVEALAEMLIALGRIGLEHERIEEIDVNPVILRQGRPVAADALVVLS
ncbi:MAG: acetate--CoA ligase family protein [Proteobacteria bacterium]|nr:acetate--CoA ligase family protein [Pseudomonadota bacterium]MBU1741270.1 acetate--CoA ligase family protein [Pseudomonadota bacterium]